MQYCWEGFSSALLGAAALSSRSCSCQLSNSTNKKVDAPRRGCSYGPKGLCRQSRGFSNYISNINKQVVTVNTLDKYSIFNPKPVRSPHDITHKDSCNCSHALRHRILRRLRRQQQFPRGTRAHARRGRSLVFQRAGPGTPARVFGTCRDRRARKLLQRGSRTPGRKFLQRRRDRDPRRRLLRRRRQHHAQERRTNQLQLPQRHDHVQLRHMDIHRMRRQQARRNRNAALQHVGVTIFF